MRKDTTWCATVTETFGATIGCEYTIYDEPDVLRKCPWSVLAALVPKPWVNLTRFHGVFAPNSRLRKLTPAQRGRHATTQSPKTAEEQHAAMTWAQRLKRLFRIDIETCSQCGGSLLQIHRESGSFKWQPRI